MRKHRNKILVLIVILAILFWQDLYLAVAPISATGTQLTEAKMLEEIQLVHGSDWFVDGVMMQAHKRLDDPENQIKDPAVNRNAPYVHVTIRRQHVWNEDADPYEVESAIATWLYLKERQLPYEISGVNTAYWTDLNVSPSATLFISRNSFDELYKEVVTSPLREQAKLTKLTERWMETNQYVNWWERVSE